MPVAVVVPYRSSCPHRDAAWAWVRARYESTHPGWQIVTGDAPPGPWVKAAAVTDALSRTGADRIVIADADVWVDNLAEAVELLDEHPIVIPHRMLKRLDRPTTEAVLAGRNVPHSYDRPPYIGRAGGGITVERRETWEQVPMDPRFVGWGQEDDSRAIALTAILGRPKRLTADMLHLWHPPQERKNRSTGSTAGRKLQRRYELAAHDPDAMRALLAEFTEETATCS